MRCEDLRPHHSNLRPHTSILGPRTSASELPTQTSHLSSQTSDKKTDEVWECLQMWSCSVLLPAPQQSLKLMSAVTRWLSCPLTSALKFYGRCNHLKSYLHHTISPLILNRGHWRLPWQNDCVASQKWLVHAAMTLPSHKRRGQKCS